MIEIFFKQNAVLDPQLRVNSDLHPVRPQILAASSEVFQRSHRLRHRFVERSCLNLDLVSDPAVYLGNRQHRSDCQSPEENVRNLLT